MDKKQALATHLDISLDDITEDSAERFSVGTQEYLVLSDDEADVECANQIRDSLWAFNVDFIASHSRGLCTPQAIKAVSEMQAKLCEDANDLMASMIDDMDHFIDDAIKSDGRGHFLSPYDGDEIEAGEYFIYRVN